MKLSPDQQVVFDSICDWAAEADSDDLLRMGGLAGCLAGDTVVKYNRGARASTREITLADLYLKFNGMAGSGRGASQRWIDPTMPAYMPALWPSGRVELNRIVGVYKSGVKPTIRMSLSDGAHLTLTTDHPIATPSGEFVRAGAFNTGDAVLTIGSLLSPKGQGRQLQLRPPRVIVNTKYHPGPTKMVMYNGIAYYYVRVARARLVVEAALNGMPYDEFVHALKHNRAVATKFKYLPLGRTVDVHHLDGDTLNDDISNLEVLAHAEHARRHGHVHVAHFKKDYTRVVKVTGVQRVGKIMTYDVQMEPPANNFVANGVFVHNTGKTTVLGEVALELERQQKIVAFATFTGRASSVLARKLKAAGASTTPGLAPDEELRSAHMRGHVHSKLFDFNLYGCAGEPAFCGTLHRLLYQPILNDKGELLDWQKREVLDRPYDLIVIDEASMVSRVIFDDLKRHGVPILAVGDHGQLPPVGEDAGLMIDPDLVLEKIHRQAEGNPIIRMAHTLRETGRLDMKLVDGEHIMRRGRRDVHAVMKAVYGSAAHPLDVGALCWRNRTRTQLNGAGRQAMGYRSTPVKGEVVIALRNKPPVFNGMRGVLAAPGEPSTNEKTPYHIDLVVDFPQEDISGVRARANAAQFGRERPFTTVDELLARGIEVKNVAHAGELYDFGYAMTVHKSQGSQFDHAILYLDRPEVPSDDDWRRWAYTAVTRAAEKLTILG